MFEPKQVSVSEFKATCLRLLEEVRQTGQSIIVTKRGEPIARVGPPPPEDRGSDWMGSMRGTVTIVGDIIAPALEEGEWEAETLREFDELNRQPEGSPE